MSPFYCSKICLFLLKYTLRYANVETLDISSTIFSNFSNVNHLEHAFFSFLFFFFNRTIGVGFSSLCARVGGMAAPYIVVRKTI